MKKLFNLARVSLAKGILEAVSAAGTMTGEEVDSLNFRHAIFYLDILAVNNVKYTVTIEESDTSGSGFTPVAAAKFTPLTGDLTDEAGQNIFEVTCKSLKRYLRMKVVTTEAGTSTMAVVYAMGDKDYVSSATAFLDN